MKNILTLMIQLFFGFCLISCFSEKQNPKYFNLINNESKSVYYRVSNSHPNINLYGLEPSPTKAFIINSGKSYSIPIGGFALNPVMQIFIFDEDVIKNNPWDSIVKYNMFLKRYQFTKSELESKNWEIIYP